MIRRGRAIKQESLLLALAAVFAGCGGAAPTASPPGPTATPVTPAPTATTAPSPAPTAAPTEAVREPCLDGTTPTCTMEGGDYRASQFGGGVSFTLIDGPWQNIVYEHAMISLVSSEPANRWIVFMSGAMALPTGDAFEVAWSAATAKQLLGALPGITLAAVDDPIEIGGLAATAFDVSNTGKETVLLWFVADSSARYTLDPGAAVRMHWLVPDADPFVLALEAPADEFGAFVEDASAMLPTIVFD